jgi:hypothetical protein
LWVIEAKRLVQLRETGPIEGGVSSEAIDGAPWHRVEEGKDDDGDDEQGDDALDGAAGDVTR